MKQDINSDLLLVPERKKSKQTIVLNRLSKISKFRKNTSIFSESSIRTKNMFHRKHNFLHYKQNVIDRNVQKSIRLNLLEQKHFLSVLIGLLKFFIIFL